MELQSEVVDLLAAFPPNRQAAIIRKYLCRVLAAGAEPPGLGQYRSADDIRVIIAADLTTACPAGMGNDWGKPGPFRKASRQRLYDALVEEFGPLCVVCRRLDGWVIDHDHITGMVRGLACRDCNQRVESCLHAESAACHMARYLNEPPAARLQLRYPARHKQKAMDVVREAILGFDIFDREVWPSPVPADWRWTVPDEEVLRAVEYDWWRRHPNTEGCPRDLFEAVEG
jgi:hypothetical protein